MLQRFVDHVLAVTKESVKTFTYEFLNNITRLINGFSALLLTVLPGKNTILEGIIGWELRPVLRGPRLPKWMEDGVSSFNDLVHELSLDAETSSTADSITEQENEDLLCPASPMSQTSRLSHMSSFRRHDRRFIHLIRIFLTWILFPVLLLVRLPLVIFQLARFGRRRTLSSDNLSGQEFSSPGLRKRSMQQNDLVVQSTTDRRRGVVEDLHLGIEILIESVFETFHRAAHFILSPSQIFGWFSNGSDEKDNSDDDQNIVVPTNILGDDDPTPTEKQQQRTLHHSLNTDARTCQDVITELGYPYEAIRVITSDGYVLLLERIPRRESKKVVFLQHGVFDSSMGWVSNGVVGSPAFAAFDQGYDVFLGNLRGLVSREHVDKNISSRKYWRYSINEHGTKDVPALIEKIHEIKTSELGKYHEVDSKDEAQDQPYKLCVVSHSLGGAVMLMYIITCRLEGKPHRVSRLILLSPAGFHDDSTIVFTVVEKLVLLLGPILAPIIPGIYIPTRFFRMLVNKLARDFQNYPAVGGLVQTVVSYLVGGDSSNWIGALGLPHYNVYDMPGVSLYVGIHLAQMKRSRKFIMFDYGSAAANIQAYGTPEPLDLGQYYNLIDIPVDLVAGQNDKVIKPSMVRKHYRLMRKAGVEVSYNEFVYAHLDFTFSHREELLAYVMSRMLQVAPSHKDPSRKGNIRLRKLSRSNTMNNSDNIEIEKDES